MPMFPYGYTQNRNCPSPEASIRLSNPLNSLQNCEILAIVDTGTAMTCIPDSIIAQLGHLTYSDINLRDANNNIRPRKTYIVNIEMLVEIEIETDEIEELEVEFTKHEVIAIPKNYALIGRDILNQKRIMLDANAKTWIYNCIGNCEAFMSEEEG